MTTQPTPSSAPEAPRYAEELAEELEDLDLESFVAAAAPDRFLDREGSWLDFNARVLDLAGDAAVPLLERIRFTAIFAGNLDEFFMVRVAGLRRRIATGIAVAAPSGLTPREQLDLISHRVHEPVDRHPRVFRDALQPALREEGICLLHYSELSADERARVDDLFESSVYPV